MSTPSIPTGFEQFFALLGGPECGGKPYDEIDGSEVAFVSINLRCWVDATKPLSAWAGVVEAAAREVGITVEGVAVNPLREVEP
jgi:hypothetical protein